MTAFTTALACVISSVFVQALSDDRFPGRIPYKPEKPPEILPYDADRVAKFFPPTDTEDGQQKLRITNIGEFSMAQPEVADDISETILSYFQTKVPLTITDVNGNMGGNSISFSRHFAKVNTCEILPQHCDVLKTNLAQFKHTANVKVHCASYLDVMDNLQQDIVFFDPPWADGPNGDILADTYNSTESNEMKLDNVNLGDIVNRLLDHAQLIAIWAPFNWNIAGFAHRVKRQPVHIHKVLINDSLKSEHYTLTHLLILETNYMGRKPSQRSNVEL